MTNAVDTGTTLHAVRALLPDGWADDVRIGWAAGRIVSVERGQSPRRGDDRVALLLPGMPDLHSHAHQRGIAGLVEYRGPVADSFWTWRELMYRFCDHMRPDEFEAIAAMAYVEMLEGGFTRVGEFHYLHHDVDGRPYADPAEMCARVAAAAGQTGIGLTLLPVFYAHGGFGGLPPGPAQRRFIHDVDGFARLLDGARRALAGLDGANLGVAPHSLRAVTPDELARVVALVGPSAPIHIHIAEQVREVEDCLAWSGRRPVAWLLEQAPVDARWCLVHATHMTVAEATGVAARGAIVGLCPITEANLGDGIFDAPAFVDADGRWGIGSDSNVEIGVAAELRLLEYSQRLQRRERNVMARRVGSTGRQLFEAALAGGHAALRPGGPATVSGPTAGSGSGPAPGPATATAPAPATGIVAGAAADLVSLAGPGIDLLPLAEGRPRADAALDAWIFGGREQVDRVWVGGHQQVLRGRHRDRDRIVDRYRRAVGRLVTR